MRDAAAWLVRAGLMSLIEQTVQSVRDAGVGAPIDGLLDAIDTRYAEIWMAEADVMTSLAARSSRIFVASV